MAMIKPIPTALQRKSLGDHVYESIRESIVTVQFEPGRMLFENELAERLGVSRTPIREAIRLLAREELVEVLPQRGTRVSFISEKKVKEVHFVREQLEMGAFRAAARLWDEKLHRPIKDELLQLIQKQRLAALYGNYAAFLAHDESFHQVMMKATGNATLLQIMTQMRAHLNRIRYLAIEQRRNTDDIIQEHIELLEAVERHDEELVAARLAAHIGQLSQRIAGLREEHPKYFYDKEE